MGTRRAHRPCSNRDERGRLAERGVHTRAGVTVLKGGFHGTTAALERRPPDAQAAKAHPAALPGMLGRKWGRIINIASVHGLVASLHKAAYVSAKHGVIGLTKTVALETAGTGITCNAICPGWALTPLVQKQIDALAEREALGADEARNKLLEEKQPSLDFATPEQLGALAVFLCSDQAAQITGASLPVDGGWLAR